MGLPFLRLYGLSARGQEGKPGGKKGENLRLSGPLLVRRSTYGFPPTFPREAAYIHIKPGARYGYKEGGCGGMRDDHWQDMAGEAVRGKFLYRHRWKIMGLLLMALAAIVAAEFLGGD